MVEEKNKRTGQAIGEWTKKFNLDNKINEMRLPFLVYDLAFRAVFTDEAKILAKMVADITGMDYNILKNNITLEATELPISSINEKAKRCDFILRIDKDNILSLELNSSHYTGLVIKNLAYLCQIFSRETKAGNQYNENLNVMQLNLNCFTKSNDENFKEADKEILNEYKIQNVKTQEIYVKNISILTLDIVKSYETYYNLGNKEDIPNYIRWGALIYNRVFEEIPNIVNGIMTLKERDKIMDKMAKLSRNNVFMTELDAMEWGEWEINSRETEAKKLGLVEGEAKGRAEGKEETIKELILSMLDNNASLEFISKVTNKSINEIKKIINQ